MRYKLLSRQINMPRLNLVFQGGGVKGIAYAGVLQSLPPDFEIKGVGGTSAGALVAALVAIGKRGKDLVSILEDPELFCLLKSAEVERYSRLKNVLLHRQKDWKSALDDFRNLYKDYQNPGFLGSNRLRIPGKLSSLQEKHKNLFEEAPIIWKDVCECWQSKGLHSSLGLRKWLDKVLQDKKFGDIVGVDLRIVATDVMRRSYSIFVGSEREGESIAHAVHASVSIPGFFEPLMSGTECFVDGGILSNFPNFLFAQSPYPTVGFRLTENLDQKDCNSTLGYLIQLFGTMVAAHDKQRKSPPHFVSYAIETPDYIPFDKFGLDKGDVNELYYRGLARGTEIPWRDSKHSSEEELVVYYDPRPDDVLHQALVQASILVEEHLGSVNWVQGLEHKTKLQVRIESDWSATYVRHDEIKVIGDKALFLQRLVIKVAREVGRLKSLADTEPRCVQEIGPESKSLVFLPVFNQEDGKGFVVFYSPPIQSGEALPRKIRTSMTIPGEFAAVPKGSGGEISMSMTRRAHVHKISATLEMLIRKDLPDLDLFPNFKAHHSSSLETIDGRRYERHTWELPEATHDAIPFPLRVKFKTAKVPH
jgi:NTE family protein